MAKVYLIGSLKNPRVPEIAEMLRDEDYTVFDDWYAAGPEADDKWQEYEQNRGRTYPLALKGYAANHVYDFDKKHLNSADMGVLITPAGKSGHLELGYLIGQGKPGYILIDGDHPARWDVMYLFAKGVYFAFDDLLEAMNKEDAKTDCCGIPCSDPAIGYIEMCLLPPFHTGPHQSQNTTWG